MLSTLLALNACTSIKIKGENFFGQSEDDLQELIDYFDEGLKSESGLTTEMVSQKIGFKPQRKEMDKNGENWYYSYSKINGRISLKLTQSVNKEIAENKEMELIFDKTQKLVAYKIRINPEEKIDHRVKYGYLILQGVLIGGTAGAAFKFIK